MFRRRRDHADEPLEGADEGASAEIADGSAPTGQDGDGVEAGAGDTGEVAERKPERPEGPWDAAEVDLDDEDVRRGRLDLGALVVKGRPAMQLRIDVEPTNRTVRSVTFMTEGSGLQLQAFAAPRTTPLWPEVRAAIAADCASRGGRARELDGPYGTELQIQLPVTTPDGKPATQSSRIVGIDGPRWLLRASFLGAATDPDLAGDLTGVLRDVVVVRGLDPMAPRDMLPLRVPAGPTVGVAQPVGGADPADPPAEGRPTTRDDLSPFRRGPEITELH